MEHPAFLLWKIFTDRAVSNFLFISDKKMLNKNV
ncbi:hypothetical protein JCM5805K_2276 [Lactococcus lactis subsp. lactis]|uniref:Uncharacterized protein n=1 Tax=Lactococcus lactis subsp. lactis TaxID=1360 RepID=A0A0B8QVV2_LACLL|nr:hypothetical protein JCM5805K_2276 [Lactococcus lactis subsp. lactis]